MATLAPTRRTTRTGTSTGNGGRARRSGGSSVGRPGVVWAIPALLFFGLFAIVPLVLVAVLSFTSWGGLGSPSFVGLDNWKTLVHDPVMVKSLWLSLLLTGLGIV